MISNEAIFKILGISNHTPLESNDMIPIVKVSFFPYTDEISNNVRRFSTKLRSTFQTIGVQIVDYNEIWERVALSKRLRRFIMGIVNNIVYIFEFLVGSNPSRIFLDSKTIFRLSSKYSIREGISIVVTGELDSDSLPMQYIRSFKTNSIITIVDIPTHINSKSSFEEHFDVSMKYFAYHMTNVIIGVSHSEWLIYNFNGSHPVYSYPDRQFESHILNSLIPKLAAPIVPHKLNDFIILDNTFDYDDYLHKPIINLMHEGSRKFANTNLFPSGKKIEDLPFRKEFHKKIGRLHLDSRNGMSFGYIAHQIPTKCTDMTSLNEFIKSHRYAFQYSDIYSDCGDNYLKLTINNIPLVLKIPEIWVLTTRSGSDKTNFNKKKDIIKMGLKSGNLYMQIPTGVSLDSSYKPSFDTKVILAHALGNVIIASVCKYLGINDGYVKDIETFGYSICHWHGYFNKKLVPNDVYIYGANNPPVSCSSPQSAVYALRGKFDTIISMIDSRMSYSGDIHVEPQHGVNVNFKSVQDLAEYILSNPNSTTLGNKFL